MKVVALVLFSLLEILLFGGVQFGWVALVFILKQEHVFESYCIWKDNSLNSSIASSNVSYDNMDCFLQDEQFNLIFSIGIALFSSATFLTGQLYISFSTKKIRIFTLAVAVAGSLCFGFTSPDAPWLPLPGIILAGVAGQSLLISNYLQVVPLLTWGASIYVGLINGCLDSSVMTMMIVKKLHEDGVNKKLSFIGLAILVVMLAVVCTLLHPSAHQMDATDSHVKTTKSMEDAAQKNDGNKQGQNNEKEHRDLAKEDRKLVQRTSKYAEGAVGNRNLTSDGAINVTVWGMFCHHLYITHVLWFSVVLLKFYYFLGSANRFMGQILQDDNEVSYFTDVMTYTMLGSLVTSFIAGYTMHAMEKLFTGIMRTVIPLSVTSCLDILLSVLAFVPTPTSLYVDFVVVTVLRSFLFCINIEYIRITFPAKYTGILYGVHYSASGVLTMVQYGLFAWTEEYNGAMTHVNVLLLFLSILSLFHPFLVLQSHRRNKRKPEGSEMIS